MKYTVNDKQLALLKRAAEASGTFVSTPNESNVVWALEERGLVKSDYASGGKAVVVTPDGRYFLKHGRHPKEVEADKERLRNDPAQAALAPADGAELIARIKHANGAVTVPDPGPGTRNRWRAAYYHALHHGHVPTGSKLRFAGRDRGDVVVRLVDEATRRALVVPTVEVPRDPARPHPLVVRTRKALGLSKTAVADSRGRPDVVPVRVSRHLVERALTIAHAVITEAERRGHEVVAESDLVRGETKHRVVIRVGTHGYSWKISERTTQEPHEPTPQELRKHKKQPWLRIPKYDDVPDGRLMIEAMDRAGYRALSRYSDAKHWTLESRLGHFLRDVENAAAAAEEQRLAQQRQDAANRRRWYDVVHEGRELQLRKHRVQALTDQVAQWRAAQDIRAFCAAAQDRRDEITEATTEWLDWARRYADSIDPLASPSPVPPDPPATPQALKEHLQGNLSAYPWPFDQDGRWIGDRDNPEGGQAR